MTPNLFIIDIDYPDGRQESLSREPQEMAACLALVQQHRAADGRTGPMLTHWNAEYQRLYIIDGVDYIIIQVDDLRYRPVRKREP